MLNSNGFNCDDPVKIKVIMQRQKLIAGPRGGSFEFSISRILTQRKSEIQK